MNDQRLALLEDEIQKRYSKMHTGDVDRLAANYGESTTDMFEIKAIDGQSVTLAHLFNDEIFEPILVSAPFDLLVRTGDVFLMSIGRRGDFWEIIWMSSPYQEEVF